MEIEHKLCMQRIVNGQYKELYNDLQYGIIFFDILFIPNSKSSFKHSPFHYLTQLDPEQDEYLKMIATTYAEYAMKSNDNKIFIHYCKNLKWFNFLFRHIGPNNIETIAYHAIDEIIQYVITTHEEYISEIIKYLVQVDKYNIIITIDPSKMNFKNFASSCVQHSRPYFFQSYVKEYGCYNLVSTKDIASLMYLCNINVVKWYITNVNPPRIDPLFSKTVNRYIQCTEKSTYIIVKDKHIYLENKHMCKKFVYNILKRTTKGYSVVDDCLELICKMVPYINITSIMKNKNAIINFPEN